MNNAYEVREHYSKEGHCIKRERTIGAIVPWAVVIGIALATGKAVTLPAAFWQLFTR
jgi:hypothetical protein